MLRNAFFKGHARPAALVPRSGPSAWPCMSIWLCLFYPSVAKSPSGVQKLIDNLPAAFKNMFIGRA